jgi:type 1 fimbria pilin
MSKIFIALAFTVLVTSAALAQTRSPDPHSQVYCNGTIVGQDPDLSIRAELLRACGNKFD